MNGPILRYTLSFIKTGGLLVGLIALSACGNAQEEEILGRLEVVVRCSRGGRAMDGITVYARGIWPRSLQPRWERRATTNENGQAVFDGLPLGPAWVWTFGDGAFADSGVEELEIHPRRNRLEYHIEEPISVRGQVLDAAGRPVVGARVFHGEAADVEHGLEVCQTNNDGTFQVHGLQSGNYLGVRAKRLAPSEFVRVDGQPGHMVEMDFVLNQMGGSVSGRVTDSAGHPVPGATLVVDDTTVNEDACSTLPPLLITTDVDGRFSCDGLEIPVVDAASPRAIAREERAYGIGEPRISFQGCVVITVRSADHVNRVVPLLGQLGRGTDVDLVLQKGVQFTGRVLDPKGRAAEGVWISHWPSDAWDDLDCISVHTDKSGRYCFRGVPPGPVSLIAVLDGVGRASATFDAEDGDKVVWDAVLAKTKH